MFPYIPNTEKDRKTMMDFINIESIDELFGDIPKEVKLNRELKLNKGASEIQVQKILKSLSNKNKNMEELICFRGAGSYDHYVPAVIKHILGRSEFFTAYTPYQPEISQGTLQAVFEYETMICDLTGMEVSNSSMYDGPTACAEAAIMAAVATRRNNIVISKAVNPETRKVLKTYLRFRNINLIEVQDVEGATDIEAVRLLINKETAAVIVQSPNFFGVIEEVSEIEKVVHENKALLIMSVDPISLGLLKSPGELGADMVVGEGQALGANMNFGGPALGFMTTTSKLMRKMPGRIVGQTEDVDGRRAFVLTIQAREQHIRREKATSNICSDQTLNSIGAAIYLSTLGKYGMEEVASVCVKKAHYAFNKLTESGKFKAVGNKPFFKEFIINCGEVDVEKVNQELLSKGILGGYELGEEYPHYNNSLLICVTENRSKEEIHKLVEIMEGVK